VNAEDLWVLATTCVLDLGPLVLRRGCESDGVVGEGHWLDHITMALMSPQTPHKRRPNCGPRRVLMYHFQLPFEQKSQKYLNVELASGLANAFISVRRPSVLIR